ncbi:MAG: hypothetical protein KJ927_17005, partial [Candidatus Eisenbacteria bacterium]|nr:hypothetical protein [Candidatus Eisenbacteria bacterium]
MKSSWIGILFLALLLGGCAGSKIAVEPLIKDFDRYEKELQTLGAESNAAAFLEAGREKRTAASNFVNNGKNKLAFPIMQKALADAQVALDLKNLNSAGSDAETCLLQVELARKRWEEAVIELEKTEDFVGVKMPVTERTPALEKKNEEVKLLFPATTLE